MDKRTYELTDAGSLYQTDVNNWGVMVDYQNTGDAKFLKFGTLFKSDRVISSDLVNNYKAMTPRSFLLSKATETEEGITNLATDNNVLNMSGTAAIQAAQTELIWEAVSSTGNFQNNWIAQSPWPDWQYVECTNVHYCGQSNITHLNGYITLLSLYPFSIVELIFNVIGPPKANSVASISCYWNQLDGNTPESLIGYAQNNNGKLMLSFKFPSPIGLDPSVNIPIYFQVSYTK